jgi:hypothetical protein
MKVLQKGWNSLVTLVLFPGILTHEVAHLLACYLIGVKVHSSLSLNFVEDDVSIEHAPVTSFPADLAIAVAPFVLNSVLIISTLIGVKWAYGTPKAAIFIWLAICFDFTAFPSESDTRSLLQTVQTLPSVARPFGYAVAAPIRILTIQPAIAGICTTLWFVLVYLFVSS